MDDVLRAIDPRGIKVTCSQERWNRHIIEESGHAIMADNIPSIVSTIESPDIIYRSFNNPQKEERNYYYKYDESATYAWKNLQTKVIVSVGGCHSEVVTTYPVNRNEFPEEEGGEVIYHAGDKI